MSQGKLPGILLCALLLWLGFLSPLYADEAQSSGQEPLTIWGSLPRQELTLLENLLLKFRQEHPEIPLMFKNFETREELREALLSGPLPHLALVDAEWKGALKEKMIPVEDLMERVSSTVRVVYKMDTWPKVWQTCLLDQKAYLLPFSATTTAVVYQRPLLARKKLSPPSSLADLRKVAKALSSGGERWGIVVPFEKKPDRVGKFWALLVEQLGGSLSDPSGKIRLNSPEGKRALQLISDLINGDRTLPIEGGVFPQEFSLGGIWVLDLRDLEKLKEIQHEVGVAPLPKGKKSATLLSVQGFAVFAWERRMQDRAWTFLSWITDFPQAKDWALQTYSLPPNKQVTLSPDYVAMLKNERSYLKPFLGALGVGIVYTSVSDPSKTFLKVGEKILSALKKETTLVEALKKAEEELNGDIPSLRGELPPVPSILTAVGSGDLASASHPQLCSGGAPGASDPGTESSGSAYGRPDWRSLEREIKGTVSSLPGEAGVKVLSLSTGETIAIHPDQIFPAASIIKIPIMVEGFRAAREGRKSWDEKLTIQREFQVGGSGILKTYPPGSQISFRKLIDLMITISDNTATDILINALGMRKINKTMKDLGLKNTVLKRRIWDFQAADRGEDNVSTAADMAALLHLIYESALGKYSAIPASPPTPPKQASAPGGIERISFLTREDCQEMLKILRRQRNRKMIPRLLPREVPVAHKTGELLGNVCSAGIVEGSHPFIFCFFSQRTSNERAREVVAQLSLKIYTLLSAKDGKI